MDCNVFGKWMNTKLAITSVSKLAQILILTVATGFLASCGTTGPASPEKAEHHWKFSTWGRPRAFTSGIDAIAAYVKRKSDGKFTIRVFHGSQLARGKENLASVGAGKFEMANYCTAYHPSRTPSAAALDLPFLPLDDLQTQRRVYDAHNSRPDVRAELENAGVRYIFSALLPRYEIMGVGEPPRNSHEIRGRTIRALGAMGGALRNLGASAFAMPASDVTGALATRKIDAVSFPYTSTFAAYKTHLYGRWFTSNLVLGAVHCPVVVNQRSYDALQPKFKKLLEEGTQVAYSTTIDAFRSREKRDIQEFKRRGLERIEFSQAERLRFIKVAGMPIWEAWIRTNEQFGLPARELLKSILEKALEGKDPTFRRSVMSIVDAEKH